MDVGAEQGSVASSTYIPVQQRRGEGTKTACDIDHHPPVTHSGPSFHRPSNIDKIHVLLDIIMILLLGLLPHNVIPSLHSK